MLAATFLGLVGGTTAASESADSKESSPRAITMRERVYEKLSQAQVAAEKEDFAEAFAALEVVTKIKDLDAYEKAQLHTAYGYIYFAQERYPQAIDAYEKVLEEKELPQALEASTVYALAQLQFHAENYEKAVGHLQRWLQTADNPGPEPLALLGQGYYQLGKHREAVEPVRRAIAVANERGQPIRESWYGLLRAIYFDLEDYPKLLEVLEVLVAQFPKKEYWIHLAAAYGQMGDAKRQLAAHEVAFAQGYLSTGSELLTFSQLLLQASVPYRAGVVLETALAEGKVESSAENWRLLSQAWILAHENQKAIGALTKASGLSDDGELHARLAYCHAGLGDWESAIEAAQVALRRGVRDPHELHITIGMGSLELGRHAEAVAAFQEAQKFPEGRKIASEWIAYIESEQERLRQLQTSLTP